MKQISFFKRFVISAVIVIFSNLFLIRAEKVQIKWFIQLSNDASDPVKEMLYLWVDNYNKSQDRIELIIVPNYASCSFDATDTLLSLINEGNPPDITTNVYSEVWKYLTDLTPYLSKYDLSQADSALFYNFSVNGKMLIMPMSVDLNLLFYNKDMFDSAGLACPPHLYGDTCSDGAAWDIEKLRETAMKLTFDTKDSNAFSPHFDKNNIRQFGFHPCWTNGISLTKVFGFPRIVSPDSVIVVPEDTRNGYKWYYKSIWNDRFMPTGSEFDSMGNDPMGSGKVAMVYTYPSYYEHLGNVPFQWDIAAPPSHNGNISIPWEFNSVGILNTCTHPEEALEVIFEVLNTVQFYGKSIPVFKNLRAAVFEELALKYPLVDWQVLSDGLNYIYDYPADGSALFYNMEAWRLANGLRDYIYDYPDADVDGALDTYFIPKWEEIFAKEDTSISLSREGYTDVNALSLKVYPVPFHEKVTFSFVIRQECEVKLAVYDLQGREIEILTENKKVQPGEYSFSWERRGVKSGIYFAVMNAGDETARIKLITNK